ncbi:MAG: mechanosensitive ion channel domain-containing protein [Acidobacteriota bacterium]
MATPSKSSGSLPDASNHVFGRTRAILTIILLALLALCIVFAWMTRDVMQHRPTMRGSAGATLVDESPWLTAQTLASLAVTAEENTYAREAERLADHDVDQAFAAALREATLRAQHRTLSGPAVEISKQIEQLKEAVALDQATVQKLTAAQPKGTQASAGSDSDSGGTNLDIAKAQLALDSDELTDANRDLERATGDQRAEIQDELQARELSMKKYDTEVQDGGQAAVLSVRRYGTLATRISAWNRQRSRLAMLQQARQETLADAAAMEGKQNALRQTVNAESTNSQANGAQDRKTQIAGLKDRSLERQLLNIYGDRIQTEQQLASVYGKWAAQVELQHRIVLHLILTSLAWIVVILIAIVLGDAMVRRLTEYPALDRRQRHTLRAILEMAIQIVGLICVLLVIFGVPRQTSTMIGLTTAALTIALQDFILAFLGWFVLMGKKGIRVGDTVEIEDVGGDVIEIGLLSTTLLETGPLTEHGYPTGRRISFMNGYAIRGKYFNFSTNGQWMIDHFEITVPSGTDTHHLCERILEGVQQETEADARLAEQEWKRWLRGEGATKLHGAADVHLRPSGSEFTLEVRYVTRASERAETRNRLYRRVIDQLNATDEVEPEALQRAPGV